MKLRRWQESDLAPFAAINACPEVMKNFPNLLTPSETGDMVVRISKEFEECALGLWAVELLATSEFIGMVGLHIPNFEAHFTPCVEVGWRLRADTWGKGYAPEAARVAMDDAYERLSLTEIVAMTAVHNAPSMRVMEKLGMQRNPADDFDHPKIAAGDRLSRHVLYRLNASERNWRTT